MTPAPHTRRHPVRSWAVTLRVALLAGVWLAAGAAGCGATSSIEFRVETVADGVRLFRPVDGGPNTTVVERSDGLLLIDAQPDLEHARALQAAIRAETSAPVRYLVISHPHREAIGGVPAFEGALVIGSTNAPAALDDPEFDYHAELAGTSGDEPAGATRPAVTLLVGGAIELADPRVSVRIVPGQSGHAPGELVVSMHDDSVIHAGGMPFADRNPFGGTASVTSWIGALNRISRRAPSVIIGTRGPALDLAGLRQRRDALAWLRSEVHEALLRGTPYEGMPAEIAAMPDASRYFDTSASPSFLEGMIAQAVEELRAQRRKRGLD